MNTKTSILAAIAAGALAFSAAPSIAATDLGNCATPGVFADGFSYTGCAGAFSGNLLNNSPASVDAQIDALNALGFNTTDFKSKSFFKIGSLGGGDAILPPGMVMTGETIFGIHFGNSSVLGNATAFYKFDAGSGTTTIPFATKGSSGFVLYQTGVGVPEDVVPEPAVWALLIAGFGLVGLAARRRTRVANPTLA